MKLAIHPQSYGTRYRFYCPGCKHDHIYDVRNDDNHPSWSFNGNLEQPTFTPSLKNITGPMPTVPENRKDAGKIYVCHLFLTNGKIQFCGDCTHNLAGQTVELPELED